MNKGRNERGGRKGSKEGRETEEKGQAFYAKNSEKLTQIPHLQGGVAQPPHLKCGLHTVTYF